MVAILVSENLFRNILEKQMVHEYQYPQGNGAVGDIERRPVQIIDLEI